ncbi:hypothetical protein [Rhodoferax koreensis]|uniref:hypothetical protein n=1 Tax=Rhodoferax koreensis TaxID=1842727 RepID=UPI0012FF8FA3|nr:hypothetical protein [Rhodoferax koreense]
MALVQGFAQEAWQRRMLRRNDDDDLRAMAGQAASAKVGSINRKLAAAPYVDTNKSGCPELPRVKD